MRRNDITKRIMSITKEAKELVDHDRVLEINKELISSILERKITNDYLDAKRGYYVIEYAIDDFEFGYTFKDLCNYNVFKSTDNITEISTRSVKLNSLYTIYSLEIELVANVSYRLNDQYVEKDVIVKTWKIAQHKDVSKPTSKLITSDNISVGNLFNFNKEKEYNINDDAEKHNKILNSNATIIENAIEKEFKYKFNNSVASEELKKHIIEFIESSFKQSFVDTLCSSGCINNCIKIILSSM